MAWVSPTGFTDVAGNWEDEALAYDGDTGTFTYNPSEDAGALEMLLDSPISCSKIRIWCSNRGDRTWDIDVFYSAAWHNIHSGTLTEDEWVEIEIGSTESVEKARFEEGLRTNASINEFEFWQAGVAHEKSLSDSVAIADSISKGVGVKKADSVALADSFAKQSEFYLAPSDTVAIADVISKGMSIPLGDSIAIVDALVASRGLSLTLSDTVAITDAIAKTIELAKTDNVVITDAIRKMLIVRAIRNLLSVREQDSVREDPKKRQL